MYAPDDDTGHLIDPYSWRNRGRRLRTCSCTTRCESFRCSDTAKPRISHYRAGNVSSHCHDLGQLKSYFGFLRLYHVQGCESTSSHARYYSNPVTESSFQRRPAHTRVRADYNCSIREDPNRGIGGEKYKSRGFPRRSCAGQSTDHDCIILKEWGLKTLSVCTEHQSFTVHPQIRTT